MARWKAKMGEAMGRAGNLAYIDDWAVKIQLAVLRLQTTNLIFRPAVGQALKAWLQDAQARTPVDCGFLQLQEARKTWISKATGGVKGMLYAKSGWYVVTHSRYPNRIGKMANPAKYAHLVEFGTRNAAAQPFFNSTRNPAKMRAIMTSHVRANWGKILGKARVRSKNLI